MTRKEEINQAAHRKYPYEGGIKGMICENSIPIFIQGAEWADETNALELFKKLPHLNYERKAIVEGGYTPSLYHFDMAWHVSWIHCEEGDTLIDFEAGTPEEAIKKAFDWHVEPKVIKK